jgi:hypothetical protein
MITIGASQYFFRAKKNPNNSLRNSMAILPVTLSPGSSFRPAMYDCRHTATPVAIVSLAIGCAAFYLPVLVYLERFSHLYSDAIPAVADVVRAFDRGE